MARNRSAVRNVRIAALVSVAAFALVPAVACAQSAPKTEVSVGAQSLEKALTQVGRQTKTEIIFSPSVVRGKKAPAVKGTLSAEEAIERLLAGSGLKARRTANGAFVVEGAEGNAFAGVTGGPADPTAASPYGDDAVPEEQEGIAEILVVGSRSQNVDIRRSEDDAQPYVVLGAAEIRQSSATNVEEFLRTRLPMNSQSASTLQDSAASITSGGGRINLRGLGTNQTLILVDGRRVAGFSNGADITQSSISGIPLAAIERIEVLPSTAGGIYGGNATGGVVNIILRRDYSGLELSALYGDTFDTTASQFQAGLTGGFRLFQGRTSVSFNAYHSRQQALLSSERDFVRRSWELQFENDPTSLVVLPVGQTSNVCSATIFTPTIGICNTTDLILDSGAPLGSPITFVPIDYPGIDSDGGSALGANAGRLDASSIPGSPFLLQAPSVWSGSLNVRHDISSSSEIYADLYRDRTSSRLKSPAATLLTLPAASPQNPFQQDIAVQVPIPDYVLTPTTRIDTSRVVLGGIYRFARAWNSSLEFGRSQSSSSTFAETATGLTVGGIAALLPAALTDTSSFPIADPDSLFTTRTRINHPVETTLDTFSFRVGGAITKLPGGPLTLSSLLEHRRETVDDFIFESRRSTTPTVTYQWTPPASQNVKSAYLELRAPLVGTANRFQGAQEFELVASLRWDRYKSQWSSHSVLVESPAGPFPTLHPARNVLKSTNYTAGVRYVPTPGITLRASHNTGFLPPALSQIQETLFTDLAIFAAANTSDPRRSNEPLTGDPSTSPAGLITVSQAGNPNLGPERSKSLSVGLIISPPSIKGLRLSLDYTRVRKTDEIALLGAQFFLDNEILFPSRIQRIPLSADDQAAGYTVGPVVFLDRSAVNISSTLVRAIDVQLDYTLRTRSTGVFNFFALASHQIAFSRRALPDSISIDTVGFNLGPLDWRANFGINWESDSWKAGWNAQYYSDYRVCRADQSESSCALAETRQGSKRVRSQMYSDIFIGYKFKKNATIAALRNLEINLGVQNIFNDKPPLLAGGFYSTYADPRLRRFTLSLRRAFDLP